MPTGTFFNSLNMGFVRLGVPKNKIAQKRKKGPPVWSKTQGPFYAEKLSESKNVFAFLSLAPAFSSG